MKIRIAPSALLHAIAGLALYACSEGESAAPAAGPAGTAPPAASAAPPVDHSGHVGHEGMSGMPGMTGSAAKTRTGGAWSELKAARAAIAEVIDAGQLSEVHARSEPLGPLADALITGAQSLPEEKRSRVVATLRRVPGVTDALHEAADGGDAEASRRQLKRLDGVIALLEAQFPADARDKVPAPGGADGGDAEAAGAPTAHDHAAHMHASRPLAAVDEAPTATLRVTSSEFKFEPQTLAMKAGEPTRIELENRGAVDHALIVASPDGKGDWIHLHALAHATDAATFRIDQPGRYEILCTLAGHTEAGMVGELVVQ